MNKEKSWKNLVDSNQNTTNPQANIELSISARNLINLDLLSKSDPQCVVYMRTSTKDEYEEIGRTEVINDDLNPNFLEKILLEYKFEKAQYLKFELWDIDLNSNDFLGRVETTLAEIITLGKNRQFIRQITGIENKNCGDLIIKVEELSTCKQNLIIKLRTVDLCKTHFFKPSAFFNIYKSNEDNSWTIVHKSSVIISSKKPSWPELNLKVKNICNNDYDRNIKIEFFNHRRNGNHKNIGCLYTSLNQLLNLEKEGNTYEIRNEKKKKTKGSLVVEYSKLTNIYSFFDYIRGNLNIKFAVAVDFTSSNSNGPPNTPSSFHFIDPTGSKLNLYQVAIRSIGNIIQYYNTSHQFAGYGFGALIPPDFKISHCFPLNNDPANPYCDSVDELLDHYRSTIENVKLSGPTCFAKIIDNAANLAKNQEKNSYSVLLIITDGVLCDLPQTKRSIIRASNLPISIIIVGVGAAADWSSMIELDSDDGPLCVNGTYATRDIVQFVEMSKYINNNEMNVVDADTENELAKEVLFEVPGQVVNYFEMQGIKPQL